MADIATISEFSGRKGDKDAGRWLKNLEAIIRGNDAVLNYSRFVEVFDMKLTGEALDWANVTPEVYNVIDKEVITERDVAQLKQAFLYQFKTIRPEPVKATDELRDLFREPSERVESYYRRANHILCRMIPGKDFENDTVLTTLTSPEKIIMQQVVDKFMSGLRDDTIEFNVWKEQPENLKNAYKLTSREESWSRFWERKKEEMSRAGYAPPFSKGPPSLQSPAIGTPHRAETNNSLAGSGMGTPQRTPPSPGNGASNGASQGVVVNVGGAGNGVNSGGREQAENGNRGGGMERGGKSYQWNNRGNPGPSKGNVDPSEPKPIIRPEGALSLNQYVLGHRKYNSRADGPLCVEYGTLGHLPRSCQGPVLAAWEKETLKRIVFSPERGPGYHSSRMSRLYQANIPMNPSEQIDCLEELYKAHGLSDDSNRGELKARAGKLYWGGESGGEDVIKGRKGGMSGRRGSHRGMTTIRAYANEGGNRGVTQLPPLQLPPIPQAAEQSAQQPREIREPQRRKRVAIEDIIDVEEGGRPAPKIIHTMSDEERLVVTKGKKRTKRPPKLIKGLMGKQRRGNFLEYLWNQSITVPLLEYLQGNPAARRDLRQATTLEGGKRKKKKRVLVEQTDVEMKDGDQIVGLNSKMNSSNENWGSFMIAGRISDSERMMCLSTARVCIDAGSEAELITPAMVEALQLETIPMSKTPWPKLKLKTSTGELRDILGITRGRISVGGVEIEFYACIIPEQSADDSEYDLLLGIPWLTEVKASIQVEKSQVTIISPTTGGRVILKGPQFSSPDFRSLFLDFTGGAKGSRQSPQIGSKLQILRDDESEGGGSYELSEEFSNEEDSEWDESGSKEEVKAPPPSPRVNARSLKLLSSRGASLELNEGETSQYITSEEYLGLYGDSARHSELAMKMKNDSEFFRREREAPLIHDHNDRANLQPKHPFVMSGKTEN